MNDRTDRILDCIDAGLQTPMPDPTYGEISPRDHGKCVRCQHRVCARDSDWCEACRAFLLGDTPEMSVDDGAVGLRGFVDVHALLDLFGGDVDRLVFERRPCIPMPQAEATSVVQALLDRD